MSRLPEELIYEILLKLLVMSLLRFRCVSKSWKTLISHPQFVKDHLHTTAISGRHRRLVSFVNDGQNEIVTCSVQTLLENPSTLTFKMDRNNYTIIGSINGLVCLRKCGPYYTLWNPSTRFESKRSPPLPDSFPVYATHIGFGYDQVNDKYKVLVGAFHGPLNVTIVHTFGIDSWTTIQNFPSNLEIYYRIGKFVSGTLNWLTDSMIFSFDMGKETYGEVSLPVPRVSLHDDYEVEVLNECLCVSYYYNCTHSVVWLTVAELFGDKGEL